MKVTRLNGTSQACTGQGPRKHAGLLVQAGIELAGAGTRIGGHLIEPKSLAPKVTVSEASAAPQTPNPKVTAIAPTDKRVWLCIMIISF
jgi:hypothetical protein